jgi:Tfp pilus assembly protein PilF
MARRCGSRARLLLLAALLLPGCVAPGDDRTRLFTEDGVEQFTKGKYRDALDSFEMALTLKPQDPALLFNMAECYDRLGDAAKAEQYYNYCLQRDPDHADARLALAALEYRTGRAGVANTMISDWLAAHPKSADAYVLDAWRLRQEKDLPHAQGRLQQALDLDPHNRRAVTEMGYLYESMGMPERALVLYERVLQRDPNRGEVAQRLRQLQDKGVKRPQLD